MFKFNFNQENDENNEEKNVTDETSPSENLKESKCIEVSSTRYAEIAESLTNRSFQMFTSNEQGFLSTEIGFVSNSTINERSESDLISGVYEGGFKVWECTQDLADYMTNEFTPIKFGEESVCDLGCSAGILGILALSCGAKSVDFQDYVS